MAVSVAIETPLQDDVRELVRKLNDHLIPLSPLEFQFKMTVEQMAEPHTTLFVARDQAGQAIGDGQTDGTAGDEGQAGVAVPFADDAHVNGRVRCSLGTTRRGPRHVGICDGQRPSSTPTAA